MCTNLELFYQYLAACQKSDRTCDIAQHMEIKKKNYCSADKRLFNDFYKNWYSMSQHKNIKVPSISGNSRRFVSIGYWKILA